MAMQPKAMTIVGWVISGLIGALLTFSAIMKFVQPADMLTQFAKFEYPEGVLTAIGVAEAVCVILYLIPQTAILGAVMTTGYLGGAIATHVRVQDNFIGVVV